MSLYTKILDTGEEEKIIIHNEIVKIIKLKPTPKLVNFRVQHLYYGLYYLALVRTPFMVGKSHLTDDDSFFNGRFYLTHDYDHR